MSGVPSPTSTILWLAEEFNSPAPMLVNFIALSLLFLSTFGIPVHLCNMIYKFNLNTRSRLMTVFETWHHVYADRNFHPLESNAFTASSTLFLGTST